MVGIPKAIKTKQDILNLFEMSKNNDINKDEFIVVLKEIKADQVFRLPILEKGENYFLIPKTERVLPAKYTIEPYLIPEIIQDDKNSRENEVFKILGEVPVEDYIELTYPSETLEKLNISEVEINNMIKELSEGEIYGHN